jgi:hypothetical protein
MSIPLQLFSVYPHREKTTTFDGASSLLTDFINGDFDWFYFLRSRGP